MTRPNATLRIRQYAPLGAPLAVIPDLGITLVSGPDGGTLQATVSTAISGSLPDDCEVAIEIYDEIAGQWIEGRDSRFVLLTHDDDDRDPTGTVTLTGIALPAWLASKAALLSVVPYSDQGNVEPAMVGTNISVSGHTFTWPGHSLTVGDRVRVTNSGKSKGLSKGAVYFVRGYSGSTFTVSHTATGAVMSFGSSHTIGMERVRTRISNLNGHQFTKNMAVSVWDANANQALTNGSQYYVVNPLSGSIQLATKPGGMPIELVADSLIVYRYLDGQRVWKGATPGQVAGDPFVEALARGWGKDSAGVAQVGKSFSNAGDSNSLAWPARVDDPTIPGVSIGFQPGTTLWAIIQFLVTNKWAEYASHARTIDLFAPLTGTDYSTGRSPLVIGTAAQQVAITRDLTEYRTTEIVRGEGPIEQVVKVGRSPWGVLEVYATASGVTSAKQATAYGQADLTQYATPQKGYTVTEAASQATVLPIFDFQRGDWVQVLVAGVPTKLRVTQWTYTKAADGTLSVSVLCEYKKRSVLSKVAHAAQKANGGRVPKTTTTTPAEIDKRKAAQPASLAVTARPTYAADGSARATVTASWLPVTTDDGGDDLVGHSYEVVLRADGEQDGKVVAVTKGTKVDLPALPGGQVVAVSVRAISSTGEAGELSAETEYVVDAPVDVPDAPSTPTVTSTLGSIVIAWDGTLVDPIDGAHLPQVADALAYVTVQRSTDGATWATEAQTLAAAGSVTDLGLVVGTTYQYRLQAVSTTGAVSAYSPVASAAVVAVDTAHINADFTQSVTDAANAASTAQTVAAQANTAAGNALTAANGKNKNTYSTSTPSGSGVAGDEWFQVDGSGNVTGQWVWTVTGGTGAWTTSMLTGAVITTLDAGKITTGTLSAARIAASSISATQLAIADFTNLFENPAMDPAPTDATLPRGITSAAGPHGYTGASFYLGATNGSNNDAYAPGLIPVLPGDQFYVQADMWFASSVGSVGQGRVGFRWLQADRSTIVSWSPGATSLTPAAAGTTRATYSGTSTVPANAAYAQVWISFANNGETTNKVYFTNVILRRKATGSLIVDGTITASKIAATAIDAMTITGATFRTASTAKTSGGVQIDSTGLHGYNASGGATFSLDTAGALSVTGATVSGQITATSGSVTGTLTVSGAIKAGTAVLNSTGLAVNPVGSVSIQYGTYADQDSTFYGMDFAIDPAGGSNTQDAWSHIGVTSNGSTMTMRSGGSLQLKSNWNGTSSASAMSDLLLTNDGSPLVRSMAIYNRRYSGAAADVTKGGSSTGIVVATNQGTLGILEGYLQDPDAYGRVVSTRAAYVTNLGTFGTTSSSRRTKNLHRHIKMDDTALNAWLGLPTWEFEYKQGLHADGEPGLQHGLVAEEVAEAGFDRLIYLDEREGPTKGQIDGFAYERMGVYNRMAIQRLYARLMEAEKQISALTRKAA